MNIYYRVMFIYAMQIYSKLYVYFCHVFCAQPIIPSKIQQDFHAAQVVGRQPAVTASSRVKYTICTISHKNSCLKE